LRKELRLVRFLLKLIVSVGLLAVLIWHTDLVALQIALSHISWRDMLAAVLILVALTPLLAWRWCGIANAVGVPLTRRSALVIVLIGTFFNQVLPSAIGGDMVRVWLVRSARVSLTKGLSSILLDRIVALFGMVLIVAVGFPWLIDIVRHPALKTVAMVTVIAGFGGTISLLLLDKIPFPRALRARLHIDKPLRLAADARAVLLSPRVAGPALLASVMIHLMVSVAVWILARGIGLSVALQVFVLLLPVVLLASLLPISIAGWGVREGAMIACLALVGVDAASAFAVSALFGLTYVIAGLPGGLAWILAGRTIHTSAPPSA